MKITKKDNHTIEVERERRVIEGSKTDYTLNYLLSQKQAIERQIERRIAEYQAGLAEVEELIKEAEKLGVTEREEELVEEEITRE